MSLTRFYKLITPTSPVTDVKSNQDLSNSGGMYGNYSWYNRLITGSSQRLVRYREYDFMDHDIDISVGLDLIAEEISGNNVKGELPLRLQIVAEQEQYVSTQTVVTLKAALKTWCNIHDWHTNLFSIVRNTVKYGDTFFIKNKNKHKSNKFVHTKNVLAASVRQDDISQIEGWQIKLDIDELGPSPYGSVIASDFTDSVDGCVLFHKSEVVRFTLFQDTDQEAPFGKSVLQAIYKTFKQKDLIEEAILIYRIQRAPEKRAFYIDVGNMNPAQRLRHMEQMKAEIKQKKVPSFSGGISQMDSVYNPMSQQEDFYFPVRADGTGSRVEVLPAGQNLGSLEDLKYFVDKIFRGLRIPKSFVDPTSEGGGIENDGKVGIAYIQEVKFALYMERLQRSFEKTFDQEFKMFLKDNGINIDPTIFKLVLPPPSNYEASRKQMMDADLLNNYSTASGINELSKRFALRKYLQLTEEDLKINERMKREEIGLNPNGDDRDLPKIYNPEQAELGGFEGGFGGSGGSFTGGGGGLDDFDGDGDMPDSDNTDTANMGNESGVNTQDGQNKAAPKSNSGGNNKNSGIKK